MAIEFFKHINEHGAIDQSVTHERRRLNSLKSLEIMSNAPEEDDGTEESELSDAKCGIRLRRRDSLRRSQAKRKVVRRLAKSFVENSFCEIDDGC